MVLKELFIRHPASKGDLLSETDKVGARVRTAQPFGTVLIPRPSISAVVGLWIRVRDMEVTVVGRGGSAEVSYRRCHHGDSLRGPLTRDAPGLAPVDRLGELVPAEQVVAMLPLDELILDDEVADLEVQSEGPALSRKLTNRCHDLLDDQLDRG